MSYAEGKLHDIGYYSLIDGFTVNPNKDFTRKKKWDFATLMKFIISMEIQPLKNELHKYFGYTTDCPPMKHLLKGYNKSTSEEVPLMSVTLCIFLVSV